jgi:hypothetical protein
MLLPIVRPDYFEDILLITLLICADEFCMELDPRDLMRPFAAEPMRMWPISTHVNKPENDDPSVLEPIVLANSAA